MNETRATQTVPNYPQVLAIGAMIPELLSQSSRWQIIKTYRNCSYCRDVENQLICIGNERIGRGPFTITCTAVLPFSAEQSPSAEVLFAHDQLFVHRGRVCLNLDGAPLWQAGFATSAPDLAALADDLALLSETARRSAPAESLGALIPTLCRFSGQEPVATTPVASLVHRHVLDTIEQLRQVVTTHPGSVLPTTIAASLQRLIGLGYGLTPSGDDFCAGYLLGLAKMQQSGTALSLAGLLHEAAQRRTTAVSLAFFQALARGLVTQMHHQLLECLGNTHCSQRHQTLFDTADHGGTSGWDTLAGLVFGIEQAIAMSQGKDKQRFRHSALHARSGRRPPVNTCRRAGIN
ncbi:DUF2877 domain-containing protein [Desulfofustis limnaeus]|jgi:hypothetical protein|uniref:DUF2877 domain-containing protein n=1 Tax=Desulfofustis limnaeus TaxID=2740163 RepID=A0ABM7WAH3_9BACT|nr:DUF2877 domain-containing protein [Desulfofustis limnaeus]MDX9895531.1 DUF2877 domain-containing protein [Desulfofustis sp.]BDD87942.1 hypothetical protein DPPLL_23070 [Desulfofustis limnaeus]